MLILHDSKTFSYLTICILYLLSSNFRDSRFLIRKKKSQTEFARKRIHVTSTDIFAVTLRHKKELRSYADTMQTFLPIHRQPEGCQSQQQRHYQTQHKKTKFSTSFKTNTDKFCIILRHRNFRIVTGGSREFMSY